MTNKLLEALNYALGTLDTLAGIAQLYPNVKVQKDSALADKLFKIIQSAIAAHQAATGQPLDLSLLQPLQPNPVPTPKV